MPPPKPHFFISYTQSDRATAVWIAWQLEHAGYRVVIQAWDFRPGQDFVQAMDNAVQQADRTVAVLSPAYLRSGFASAEWRAAFRRDPQGERGLLLPVKVQACELPGLLGQIVHIDLVGLGTAEARQRLLAGIDLARQRPTTEPDLPPLVPGPPAALRSPEPDWVLAVRAGIGLVESAVWRLARPLALAAAGTLAVRLLFGAWFNDWIDRAPVQVALFSAVLGAGLALAAEAMWRHRPLRDRGPA